MSSTVKVHLSTLSIKIPTHLRTWIEQEAARRTIASGDRWTLTDVVVAALAAAQRACAAGPTPRTRTPRTRTDG